MDPINELQEATRAHIRTMLRITGWTPSRLADEAGLASSTLNRFLNQSVKHNLSQRTMAALVATTFKEAKRKIEEKDQDLSEEFIEDFKNLAKLANTTLPDTAEDLELTTYKHVYNVISEKNNAPADGYGQWGLSAQEEEEISQYLAKVLIKRHSMASDDKKHPAFDITSAVSDWITQKVAQRSGQREIIDNIAIPIIMEGLRGTNIKSGNFGNIIATTQRPPFLHHDTRGFAVYIISRNMEPRYSPRSLVYAAMEKNIDVGSYCVLETKSNGVIVARLTDMSEDAISVEFLSSKEPLTISRNDVSLIAKIVGNADE